MDTSSRQSVTRLLSRAQGGDGRAAERLMPLVYGELRSIAAVYLEKERPGHTLQPTALVHEAFLRLFDARELGPLDREHFIAIAANVMRRVLVDHARSKAAEKRGGGVTRITSPSEPAGARGVEIDLIALDEALERLAVLDARQARIVELRYFAGLTLEEVAGVLDTSKRTVEGDWTLARIWLKRELSSG